jgi:hypothetical protein
MAYVTIIFAVILGLLGYLGSAKRINLLVRTILSLVFAAFLAVMMMALNGSMKFHNALHLEISQMAEDHPEYFDRNTESELYQVLTTHLHENDPEKYIYMAIVLGLVVVAGIMTIGEGSIIPSERKGKLLS